MLICNQYFSNVFQTGKMGYWLVTHSIIKRKYVCCKVKYFQFTSRLDIINTCKKPWWTNDDQKKYSTSIPFLIYILYRYIVHRQTTSPFCAYLFLYDLKFPIRGRRRLATFPSDNFNDWFYWHMNFEIEI